MEALSQKELDRLRLQLSVEAKNGLNFIVAAAVVWSLIAFVWTLPYRPQDKGAITFMVGGLMLPLAWVFSKLLNTRWTVDNNPIQALGLWLNFAQLFYFPILVFVYLRQPEHFIMVYVIITGAHLFPYAWFYNTPAFAVMAGVIALGAMALALVVSPQHVYVIPLFTVAAMLVLGLWLWVDYRQKKPLYKSSL